MKACPDSLSFLLVVLRPRPPHRGPLLVNVVLMTVTLQPTVYSAITELRLCQPANHRDRYPPPPWPLPLLLPALSPLRSLPARRAGFTYSGERSPEGLADGIGVMSSRGTLMTGTFVHGTFEGQGSIVWAGNGSFTGSFKVPSQQLRHVFAPLLAALLPPTPSPSPSLSRPFMCSTLSRFWLFFLTARADWC